MSKFHGDQYWSQLRHQVLQDWQDTSEDELEKMHAIRYSREVRARDERARARRERQSESRELDV
jgi:hypothetical protein